MGMSWFDKNNSFSDLSGGQEGGLTDVAIEVLHKLLTHVIHAPKEQVGVGDDQVNAFLDTLKRGIEACPNHSLNIKH